MKRKNRLYFATVSALLLALPTIAPAGVTIDQVKTNVVNMWKPLKEHQPHVTAEAFKKIVNSGKPFILVDVRAPEEYEAGHLPGAINIDRGRLEWVVPKRIKNTDTTIYIYCRTGARGAFSTQRLIEMGYPNTFNIYDGFKGWVEDGYPVYNRHGEFLLDKDGFEKADIAQVKNK